MNLKRPLSVAAIALAAILGSRVAGEDSPGAEGMKRYQEACTPGAAHRKLEAFVGEWETSLTIQMGGQRSPASKGTASVRWLFPGRWLANEHKGQFSGMLLLGFDNFKGRYVMSSVDTMETSLKTASGLWNRDETALSLHGTIDEPLTPEQDKPVKYVWRIVDKDHLVFEVHDLAIDPGDTKVIEVEYTRKK